MSDTPLTDGTHELVAEAVVSALEDIDAADAPSDWYYGPSRVFRARSYEARYFTDEVRLFHVVRQDTLRYTRLMNCEWSVDHSFYVLACLKDDSALELPWTVESSGLPLPTTDQHRLLADMERALLPVNALGMNEVDWVDFTDVELGLQRDGWTITEVRCEVTYRIPTPTSPQ